MLDAKVHHKSQIKDVKTPQTNSNLLHFHVSDRGKHSALTTVTLGNTYTKTLRVGESKNNNLLSEGCRLEAELMVIPAVTRSLRSWWRTDEPAPWQQISVWMAWRPKIAAGGGERKKNNMKELTWRKVHIFKTFVPIYSTTTNILLAGKLKVRKTQVSSQTAGGSGRGPGCATVWFQGISVPTGCSMRWDCPQASLPRWANRSPWQRSTQQGAENKPHVIVSGFEALIEFLRMRSNRKSKGFQT